MLQTLQKDPVATPLAEQSWTSMGVTGRLALIHITVCTPLHICPFSAPFHCFSFQKGHIENGKNSVLSFQKQVIRYLSGFCIVLLQFFSKLELVRSALVNNATEGSTHEQYFNLKMPFTYHYCGHMHSRFHRTCLQSRQLWQREPEKMTEKSNINIFLSIPM